MKTYSKRKRLIKTLKHLSIAGSIFTLSIIAPESHDASAHMFSRFWQSFKSSMSSFGNSVRARLGIGNKTISITKLASGSSKSSWKDPFRKLARRFRDGDGGTKSKSEPIVLTDGAIYQELKGDPPYKTPRARKLGSIPSVILNDDGSGDSTSVKPNVKPNKPVHDDIFDIVTSNGSIKKVIVTQKTGDGSKLFPTDESVRKNINESNEPVNNFETIYSGNGTQSTFKPGNEAKVLTTRRNVVKDILKNRSKNK